MAIIRTDSPISRRIVSAFLNFLDSVQPAPGVDLEGLEVAKDCLAEVFRLSELPTRELPEPNLLVNIFSSQESTENEVKSTHSEELHDGPSACSSADDGPSGTSKVQDGAEVREQSKTGESKDELFGQFFDALERINFFRTTPNGDDDNVLLDRATTLFHEAVDEMERSGCQILDRKSLADALKTLGNKAVQSKLYADAIERYTCAIALCENNAVYYCNRAAAYTQMHKYNEAIEDCLKSIEIDPNYSKAYSRLGLAYYAQGNYRDAINKGFRKGWCHESVAEQKLKEEQERRQRYQDTSSHFPGGSGNQAGSPPFASMSFETGTFPANFASMFSNMTGSGPRDQHGQSRSAEDDGGTHSSFTSRSFDSSANPADIASMFMNMAGSAFQGQNSTGRAADQNNGSGPTNPFSSIPFDPSALPNDLAGAGIGANISLNFGEQTPEELARTLRSVMGMFSGGVPGDPQSNGDDGRSASR
ncbi:hypothetical protein Cgig2_004742 [Carnegiea gigantea]|uniref:SGTA homodimerisation domain-containing protein n=1 Tax=Carnegiea gigantea TaxID=171969 RepID=A0A9Q1QS44_9CARY|nr:hypothetical protein Cgig2_004742 [Carnegiea gigantea]